MKTELQCISKPVADKLMSLFKSYQVRYSPSEGEAREHDWLFEIEDVRMIELEAIPGIVWVVNANE